MQQTELGSRLPVTLAEGARGPLISQPPVLRTHHFLAPYSDIS